MKIYILLPIHNRREITRQFVRCLKRQTFTDYHLVVVDDGSSDGTVDMVKGEISVLTVLKGDGSLWWAGSLQRALGWLRRVRPEPNSLILMINDDVQFEPDYLERAARLMSTKTKTLLLSRFLLPDTGEVVETGVYADLEHLAFKVVSPGERINCLSTRGLFIYWADVLQIGNFHPKLLPHYLSDYEYTIRAYRKGFKMETSAEVFIVPNYKETGHRVNNTGKFVTLLRQLFSRKSANNPFYLSSFIFLAVRPTQVLPNLIRVWYGTIRLIFAALFNKYKYRRWRTR